VFAFGIIGAVGFALFFAALVTGDAGGR